jgi:hypothetical protein
MGHNLESLRTHNMAASGQSYAFDSHGIIASTTSLEGLERARSRPLLHVGRMLAPGTKRQLAGCRKVNCMVKGQGPRFGMCSAFELLTKRIQSAPIDADRPGQN